MQSTRPVRRVAELGSLGVMPTSTTTPRADRWLLLLIVTIALNLGSAFLFPMPATGFSYTPRELLVRVIPIIWGFSILFFHRTKRERYVAGLAAVGAFYWAVPTVAVLLLGGR